MLNWTKNAELDKNERSGQEWTLLRVATKDSNYNDSKYKRLGQVDATLLQTTILETNPRRVSH